MVRRPRITGAHSRHDDSKPVHLKALGVDADGDGPALHELRSHPGLVLVWRDGCPRVYLDGDLGGVELGIARVLWVALVSGQPVATDVLVVTLREAGIAAPVPDAVRVGAL